MFPNGKGKQIDFHDSFDTVSSHNHFCELMVCLYILFPSRTRARVERVSVLEMLIIMHFRWGHSEGSSWILSLRFMALLHQSSFWLPKLNLLQFIWNCKGRQELLLAFVSLKTLNLFRIVVFWIPNVYIVCSINYIIRKRLTETFNLVSNLTFRINVPSVSVFIICEEMLNSV